MGEESEIKILQNWFLQKNSTKLESYFKKREKRLLFGQDPNVPEIQCGNTAWELLFLINVLQTLTQPQKARRESTKSNKIPITLCVKIYTNIHSNLMAKTVDGLFIT